MWQADVLESAADQLAHDISAHAPEVSGKERNPFD